MAIVNAVQRGAFVYVYNEKGQTINTISAGSGIGDGLTGYTASSVSIRRGSFVYAYNDKGMQIGCVPAR